MTHTHRPSQQAKAAKNPKNNQCSICGRWYDDSTSEKRARHFKSMAHLKARYGA